jgi:thioredoxin reductase
MRAVFGDLTPYGLQSAMDGVAMQLRELAKVPVIDVGTIALIKQRKILIFPGVEQFTPDGVRFADGTVGSFDAVVLATGYHVQLRTLLAGCNGVLDARGVPLVSGRATAVPGLYFCGYRNSIGGLLRQIGHEARDIASDISAARGARKEG